MGENALLSLGGAYCQLSHVIHNLAGGTKLTYLKYVCQIIHAIAYPPLHDGTGNSNEKEVSFYA